jgi:hypothetical protein
MDAAAHHVNADSFGGFFPSIGINITEQHDSAVMPLSVRLDTNAFDMMRTWAQKHLGWRRWSLPLTGPLFGGKVDRTMKWKFASPLGTSHFAATGPAVVAQVFRNATGALQFSPRFLSLFQAVYGQIASHLRTKGWLTNTSVMWHDEPDWADAETLAIWLKIANLWKSSVATELRLYQTFATPAPNRVLRMLDQACVHVAVYRGGQDSGSGLRGVYAQNLANISRTTGLELTTYSNELAVIDLPAGAIRMRTFPWMLWSTNFLNNATAGGGLQGFMQTVINGIGHLSNIDANVSFESVDANAYPGRYNISGLWFMTYPSRLSGVQPPVSSIRWEMLRQGLQDVEQLALLDRLVHSARQQCRKSRSVPICDAADKGWFSLQGIKKGVWDFSANFDFRETEYTHDPSVIDSILLQIGDACEHLLKLGADDSGVRGTVAAATTLMKSDDALFAAAGASPLQLLFVDDSLTDSQNSPPTNDQPTSPQQKPAQVVLRQFYTHGRPSQGPAVHGSKTDDEALGELVLVHDEARARDAACLDGSVPGYWVRRSSSSVNRSKWILHLQGGGWW